MESLYLLQFASLIFMLINAAIIALSYLHTKWENKRYERSRWMIFSALIGMAAQYYLQMKWQLRASGDDVGAVVNMLIYTPCFSLISMGIYNIEATHTRRRKMNAVCATLYAGIITAFFIGHEQTGCYHIGWWLYVMLAFYGASVVYCVSMISREMIRRRRMLETMAANDIVPYLRYSRASLIILFLAALFMPFAILSTTLLLAVGPFLLLALLFFNVTFISLGSNYIPTEELLDKEAEMEDAIAYRQPLASEGDATDEETAVGDCDSATNAHLSEEKIQRISELLDRWRADRGYRDSTVNMLTLSRSLGIAKGDLTQYFDQCVGTTFRLWLSDIRFAAAKAMMEEFPDYSNDVISAECGFSSRSQLYRIFKTKLYCTPTAWREKLLKRV